MLVPGASLVAQRLNPSVCNAGDLGLIPRLGRSPGGGNGNPLPVLLPRESHGQRSLVGYSPRGRKEPDTLTFMLCLCPHPWSPLSPTAKKCLPWCCHSSGTMHICSILTTFSYWIPTRHKACARNIKVQNKQKRNNLHIKWIMKRWLKKLLWAHRKRKRSVHGKTVNFHVGSSILE